MNFVRCRDVLGVFYKTKIASELERGNVDKAKNVDFRVYDQGIWICERNKHELYAYYDKRFVLNSGIQGR